MLTFEVRQDGRSLGTIRRAVHDARNWQWVSYMGRRYQLFEGRNAEGRGSGFWINIDHPIKKGR